MPRFRLLLDPNVQACIHEISRKQLAELRSEEHAIAEAYRGNMEWLLKRHPQYKNKRPLRPPKLKHGEHREKASELQLLIKLARDDTPRIKALWKAEYDGKCHRPQGQITAIEIAAYRWGIAVNLSKRRLRAAIVHSAGAFPNDSGRGCAGDGGRAMRVGMSMPNCQ